MNKFRLHKNVQIIRMPSKRSKLHRRKSQINIMCWLKIKCPVHLKKSSGQKHKDREPRLGKSEDWKVLAPACNPSTQETAAGLPWLGGLPDLYSEPRASQGYKAGLFCFSILEKQERFEETFSPKIIPCPGTTEKSVNSIMSLVVRKMQIKTIDTTSYLLGSTLFLKTKQQIRCLVRTCRNWSLVHCQDIKWC